MQNTRLPAPQSGARCWEVTSVNWKKFKIQVNIYLLDLISDKKNALTKSHGTQHFLYIKSKE
jgi:hypothetical protein